jgi:hypothetical protein
MMKSMSTVCQARILAALDTKETVKLMEMMEDVIPVASTLPAAVKKKILKVCSILRLYSPPLKTRNNTTNASSC